MAQLPFTWRCVSFGKVIKPIRVEPEIDSLATLIIKYRIKDLRYLLFWLTMKDSSLYLGVPLILAFGRVTALGLLSVLLILAGLSPDSRAQTIRIDASP